MSTFSAGAAIAGNTGWARALAPSGPCWRRGLWLSRTGLVRLGVNMSGWGGLPREVPDARPPSPSAQPPHSKAGCSVT